LVTLSEELVLLRASVDTFAREEVAPRAAAIDLAATSSRAT